jgi:hypothetical protein
MSKDKKEEIINELRAKYFKDGETAQHTLEEIGMFEQMGKQYILTQDIDDINLWIKMRPTMEGK